MTLLTREVAAKYNRSRQSILSAISRGALVAEKNRSGDFEITEESAEKYYSTKYSKNTKKAASKRFPK